MHTWLAPRSFAISFCAGSASFLVTHDRLEVCPFARRDPDAVPIRSITNGLCFLQLPLSITSTAHLAMTPASTPRRDVGFTVFRSSNMDGLAPVSMPAAILSVCPHSQREQPTACLLARASQRLWLSRDNGTYDSSPELDMSSSLTLRPPLTLAVAGTLHSDLLAPVSGGMLFRQLSTRPLPVAPMPIG